MLGVSPGILVFSSSEQVLAGLLNMTLGRMVAAGIVVLVATVFSPGVRSVFGFAVEQTQNVFAATQFINPEFPRQYLPAVEGLAADFYDRQASPLIVTALPESQAETASKAHSKSEDVIHNDNTHEPVEAQPLVLSLLGLVLVVIGIWQGRRKL